MCDRRIRRPLLQAECGGSTLLHSEEKGSLITNFKAPLTSVNLLKPQQFKHVFSYVHNLQLHYKLCWQQLYQARIKLLQEHFC